MMRRTIVLLATLALGLLVAPLAAEPLLPVPMARLHALGRSRALMCARTPIVQWYAKELGRTFPFVLDSRGQMRAAYGAIGLPTPYLISWNGQAVALVLGSRDRGGMSALALIHARLAESAASEGVR